MKRLLLSVLLVVTGCGRTYYQGQPVELSSLHWEVCSVERPPEFFHAAPVREAEISRFPTPNGISPAPATSSIPSPTPATSNIPSPAPTISGQDDESQAKCTTKIKINGREQEVDSKDLVWRWP
ncbi:hypothetical protein NDI44_27000 [Trichocoleus sp. DQ-A3]|uniref:hypothetical protein n=1 Tax=Cyanophyceae TaxID=3028117 RepID=UPI0016825FAB|nr:hypothetical protein [Coleofasciculus sp. FACHB-125]MBD1903773.1 hypothetical protein [Coleofasciculus sp. FACHB-125]